MVRALILVADHNPFVRKSVREFLGDLEADVHEALSGAELLGLARDFPPDVIILEKNLPGPGGRNILKAIRGENGLHSVPIIILRESDAGNGDDAHPPANDENGFDVIVKPLERKQVIESVQKALQREEMGKKFEPAGKHVNRTESFPAAENKHGATFAVDESHPIRISHHLKFSEFTDSYFYHFQDFLLQKVGLYFDIKRKHDLEKALANRMAALGMLNYLEYYQYLSHSLHEEKELRSLVLYLTIGETTYFRSPDQFKALREYILPRLIAARKKMPRPMLRIWSAGCSTGEEPYSVAITLRETIPDIDRWDIHISATDINQKFLHFAQEGFYPPRKVRFVRDDILHRYFTKEGDHYKIKPEVSRMVKFDFHNLSTESYAQFDGSDIVLCRNVLIYFRRDRIRQVIDKFKQVLVEDGYLVLGYSETLFQVSGDFKSIHYGDAFFYVRSEKDEEDTRYDTQKSEMPFKQPVNVQDIYAKHLEALEIGKEQPSSIRVPDLKYSGEPVLLNNSATKIKEPTPPPMPVETRRITAEIREEQTAAATDNEMGKLWEEGINHYFYEQFDMAEEVFKRLAEKFSQSAHALLGLGFIHANRGEDALAAEKIEQALQMDKLLPEAYYLRALIGEKNGNIEAAMADYRNVILLDPDFAMAHFNLGILYMKQNRTRDCRREFRNTLNILKGYEAHHNIKFSGGLHRGALMQLCEDLSE